MGSTTRSRARVRARREEVAQRVLDTVGELIADGTPYTELPVQRIAAAAGVPRSTVYLHFPDKGQLLLALADDAIENVLDVLRDWKQSDRPDDAGPLVAASARIVAEYRRHLRVLLALHEVAAYDEEVAEHLCRRLASVVESDRQHLEAEQRAGRINSVADPAAIAHLLHAMVASAVTNHCRIDDGSGDAALARALARTTWLMIYGDAPRSSAPS